MKYLLAAASVLLLAACGADPPVAAANPDQHEHLESRTSWSAKTECLIEYPALVKEDEAQFTIFVTRLETSQPLASGVIEMRLSYPDGWTDSVSIHEANSPGIFQANLTPRRAGSATLVLTIQAPGLVDSHKLDNLEVYADEGSASHTHPDKSDTTSKTLAKPQQWAVGIATGIARTERVHNSVRVPAEVEPRSGGEVEVMVPFNGRMVAADMPGVGTRVSKGQVLASILPPTPSPADQPSLVLAVAEAEAALSAAGRELDRAEKLVQSDAAPVRRLEDARTQESVAKARLEAARMRLRQFDASRSGEGDSGPVFALRAPFDGTVKETHASPGANVEAGESLFRLVDTDRVYIVALVPESQFGSMRELVSAELDVPGAARTRVLRRPLSVGRIVDPKTRTFSVIWELDNRDGLVAIHQNVTLRLLFQSQSTAVVVPETAIVDDGGLPVVYVQRGGETFEKRLVDVLPGYSGMAAIRSGIARGERVVVRGGSFIRLASLSNQSSSHGHTH